MKPQNKMGVVPINKLLLSMGMPMIISMMVQAFYNIVDSYFVSQMPEAGEKGLAALALAFPIQILMIAIGVGTGVGINSLLSRGIGEGNRERASKIAGNAIFLGACTYIAFLLIGLFLTAPYIRSQTSDAVMVEMGSKYLSICCTMSFGAILAMIYEKLLQGVGRTVASMAAQLAGAFANIALDPIMIFGLFGFPAMGIAGAAYATVIGQILTLVVSASFHHFSSRDLDTGIKYFKPDSSIIKDIYKIGIPAVAMQALASFMTYGINVIFGRVSGAALTAYGVYYKIQQFVFFTAFGMSNALIPIVAFNYGMRDKKRVNDSIKYGMIYTLTIMTAGAILLQAFAKPLIGIFSLSDATLALTVRAVRIVTLGYIFAAANIVCQGVFQAFGSSVMSLSVSLLRMIVFALPAAFLLSLLPNSENLVWWAFPIAEGLALVVAVFEMSRATKVYIEPLLVPDIGIEG